MNQQCRSNPSNINCYSDDMMCKITEKQKKIQGMRDKNKIRAKFTLFKDISVPDLECNPSKINWNHAKECLV